MPRVLLLLPSATYRATDFLQAAASVGAEVVVASEMAQTLAHTMGDRALVVDLCDPDAAAEAIVSHHRRLPLEAVVAVDDEGTLVAARAAQRLGLRHNPPDAVAVTRDKARMRVVLSAAGLPQPRAVVCGPDDDPSVVGLPVVVKARGLSASRGVIRADDPEEARRAADRVRLIAGTEDVLAETYVDGDEVALEGLLRDGSLEVLAVFDKPDPLVGPFFEETIYVTPSRRTDQGAIVSHVARAAEAIGLREGPVHAEARISPDGTVTVLELAGRSIGGLCSRSLRFGLGVTLEEVILRHALGLPLDDLRSSRPASGVMMLPIPRPGVLRGVEGREEAAAVPGVLGVEVTIAPGSPVVPLPEGDRYLGFVFAVGDDPASVEASLREAHSRLRFEIE
ncbi:MAG TPA: ATP-grasp domain-containing protein [Actinomycetota bacterium]|nr:ATP-grasp domain-containing protein [Actinomycetota bacterium]